MSPAIEDTLFGVLKMRREVLVACWGAKIRAAVDAPLTTAELLDKMPAFVDEIIAALYPDAVPLPVTSGNAEEHGAQRLRLHFDVAEVVREYGLLHECILEIARDSKLTISLREQQVISRWLNSGIADALAQYVKRRDMERDRQTSEHLGFIAHELRNPLSAARAAVQRLRNNERAVPRVTELLERSLRRASDMIDKALSHASLNLGVEPSGGAGRARPICCATSSWTPPSTRRPEASIWSSSRWATRSSPPTRACCAPRSSTWFRTRSSSAARAPP